MEACLNQKEWPYMKVSGGCLDDIWLVSGGCLDDVLKVSGGYLWDDQMVGGVSRCI